MTNQVSIKLKADKGNVSGYCTPQFKGVLDAFVNNFNKREEIGASVCLNVEGENVVNLWGGRQHPKQNKDWQEDTLVVVHSITKAAVSICAHLLIVEGKLDLNALVSDYWPEFGQAGKEDTTVRMMLNHSSPVPAIRQPLKKGAWLDWEYMVDLLAKEEAFWKPGTAHGYQMTTYGWTVGELVRRASGMSLGTFFHKKIAEPLGLDFHIGLPVSEHHRVSRVMHFKPTPTTVLTDYTKALIADPTSIQYLALLNNGGYRTDAPESYACEFGAGGGIATAKGVADMFAPLANGGGQLFDRLAIERMSAVSVASGQDRTLLMPSRFGLGFMLSMDNRYRPQGDQETLIIGKQAFGHAGVGGSLGFADPACHLGFGYIMNKIGGGIMPNDRGQSLVDAAYRSLGYTTDAPGYWIQS